MIKRPTLIVRARARRSNTMTHLLQHALPILTGSAAGGFSVAGFLLAMFR